MPHPDPCPTCQRISDAHGRGVTGRNDLAKVLGVALATVTNHAKHCGISFDRSKTAVAVAARQIDLKARRQVIRDRIYARIEKNLDRLEHDDGYTYSVVLPGSAEDTARIIRHTDDDPPSGDERNHMHVVTGYLAAVVKLEQVDADGNTGEVHSVLDTLAEGFARAAAGYQPTADDLDP